VSSNYSHKTKSLVELGVPSRAVTPFEPSPDTLTYEPFFGLTEKPFSLIADSRFVYESPGYRTTRDSLLAGLRRREGLQVLTGEIGTGKTTLCRAVLRDLGRKTYSSMVPDPFASREDLLKMLLIDFGVLTIQELTSGRLRQASRTELGYLLSEFLDSLAPDAFAVVVIDEAQNLSLPLIEESRILSDTFAADGRLQIVFVGQPELHAKLKLPEMRQVDQRVCGYHRLGPLGREAVEGYIQHRLQVAGGHRERVLFSSAIIDDLYLRSGGVPRLINRVCDRALQLAYERQAEDVNRETLHTVLLEIGSATMSPTWDSIIFAEPASLPATVAAMPLTAAAVRPTPLAMSAVAPAQGAFAVEPPKPAALAPAGPAPVAPAVASADVPKVQAVGTPPAFEDDDSFEKQINHWVEKDLAPASRRPRAFPPMFAEAASVAPAEEARPAVRRTAPARSATTDWSRSLRSETYMQRLWRKWGKRAAIAAGVLVAVLVTSVGAAVVRSNQTAPVLPARPEAPAKEVGENAGPPSEAPAPASPDTEAQPTTVTAPATTAPVAGAPVNAAIAAAGDYLVSVGLFSSPVRADQLVAELTQAGLPAVQRPFRLRQRNVQQIVLGPFSSRADAVAGLRRLQALGGYEDASVIDSTRQ
jgi:type II secretory pathway predicted ATPase ExeA/cell division septation protein DedD